jgi:hypothetical protein
MIRWTIRGRVHRKLDARKVTPFEYYFDLRRLNLGETQNDAMKPSQMAKEIGSINTSCLDDVHEFSNQCFDW